jgi:hypothetical protein
MVNPAEFFHQQIRNAVSNQQILVSEDLCYYMGNLLCEFISLPSLTIDDQMSTTVLDEPLAFIWKQATEAPPSKSIKIYKRVGDTSLFMAGFFQDFFNRKCFDSTYFITLGSSAYSRLAYLVHERNNEAHLSEIYDSLSTKLPQLVDVLAEVSEQPGNVKPTNVLAIYDRWARTGSGRLRQTLVDLGITPIPNNVRKAQ